MTIQCVFTWHPSDDPQIWERIKEERLARVLLPHCSKPTRRDWDKNVSECIMAKVWGKRVPDETAPRTDEFDGEAEGGSSSRPADLGERSLSTQGVKEEAVPPSPEDEGFEWAGICYLSNGFGMTPYVHFALFRTWRPHAEILGREALAWIFRRLKCPAVLGWTPACFKHVEPLLKAWGFRDLATIPQGFAFAEKDNGNMYFRDGVLRIRKK